MSVTGDTPTANYESHVGGSAMPLIVIRRHIVGLAILYVQYGLALITLGILGFILAPEFLHGMSGDSLSMIASGTLLVISLVSIFIGVATVVYRRNQISVTDHDLEEINQKSLLARRISRLEMNDVEDVHSEQRGLMQTIFGYGTLVIQTAGARDNFDFYYCPRPDYYAEQILQIRARFIEQQRSR